MGKTPTGARQWYFAQNRPRPLQQNLETELQIKRIVIIINKNGLILNVEKKCEQWTSEAGSGSSGASFLLVLS